MVDSPNPHLQTDTITAGAADAKVATVLVHGRDQAPDFMLDVARRIGLAGVAHILPTAAGSSWYPGRYMDPIADNEPWLTWSLDAIDAAVTLAGAGAGRAPERVVLAGFSQGACLVAEHIATRPVRYGAAAVLTGARFGLPSERRSTAGLDGLPVFFGTAPDDDWVRLADTVDTVEALRAAGADCNLRVYEDKEHHVNDDEAAAVGGLLERLAAA